MTDQSSQTSSPKSIYDASAFEVFGKNFLAGMAHALGAVLIQLCFIGVLAYLSFRYFLPQIQPLLDMMNRSVSAMEQLQGGLIMEQNPRTGSQTGSGAAASGTTTANPQVQQLQQLLQQYQQSQPK